MVRADWLLDDGEREFLADVRRVLDELGDEIAPLQYFEDRGGATRRLYQRLGREAWLGLSWPAEVGGAELGESYEFLLWSELAYRRGSRPDIAAGIIGKSIVAHGTPEQRERYLPRIARGEISFALGYSEPEAGSDLGSLRTRARRDGDAYIVDGEKRWTSDAHTADHLWLLCRTGEQAAHSRALTLLLVPTDSPGVTIRPIPTLDGHPVNEVHLDGVSVPAENRVGEENVGWTIVAAALARERHLQVLPGRVWRDLDDLVDWAAAAAVDRGEARLDELERDAWTVEAATLRVLQAVTDGRDSLALAARARLLGGSLLQRIARTPVSLGRRAALSTSRPLEFLWRQSPMETVAGGATEIMRDIVAARELALR